MKNAQVNETDNDIRLDKWFKRHIGVFKISELNRCLREKNIKLNDKRADAKDRIKTGDIITYPDSFGAGTKEDIIAQKEYKMTDKEIAEIQSWVIYKDKDIIAINKPSGLATQGGSGQTKYLDNMLSALSFGISRPKLVHRLDKDTSGVLVLARNEIAAIWLTRAFRDKDIRKTYYAVLEKRMKKDCGLIDAALKKAMIGGQELVVVDKKDGKEAKTKYEVVSTSSLGTLMKYELLTGRTHQLRVHSKYIGHPIVGDKKYGNGKGKDKLLLHSTEIVIRGVGKNIVITAPLPLYMVQAINDMNLDTGETK